MLTKIQIKILINEDIDKLQELIDVYIWETMILYSTRSEYYWVSKTLSGHLNWTKRLLDQWQDHGGTALSGGLIHQCW